MQQGAELEGNLSQKETGKVIKCGLSVFNTVQNQDLTLSLHTETKDNSLTTQMIENLTNTVPIKSMDTPNSMSLILLIKKKKTC